MDPLTKIVALSLMPNLGPVAFKNLLAHFGDVESVFQADMKDFAGVHPPRRIDWSPLKDKNFLKQAELEIEKAHDRAARIVTFFDDEYPKMLKEIYDPPILLYVKGALPPETAPKVAVVGSRIASIYGLRTARRIAKDLAARGVVIVSGMAKGIDTAAHEGALEAGGVTVAVLGGGLSKLYPPENRELADHISEKGAVISEYPMDMAPLAEYFPVRNRIISGLSRGVLIVEAAEKSGALITADAALAEGRDVFAVPGNVDSPRSQGTNALIQSGARMVLSAEDILEEWKTGAGVSGEVPRKVSLSKDEEKILSVMESEPLSMDDLIEKSEIPAPEAISAMTILEMKGCVKRLPGQNFVRV